MLPREFMTRITEAATGTAVHGERAAVEAAGSMVGPSASDSKRDLLPVKFKPGLFDPPL
jgi:hypothetical protein